MAINLHKQKNHFTELRQNSAINKLKKVTIEQFL